MSRRRLFASLCSMVFLVNLARVVFAPLVQPLSDAFGVSPGVLGVVTAGAWLGSALPRIPTGFLLTRVPRHHVIAGAGAVLTAASLFAAMANSVTTLAGGALLMGLASGAYFVAANPLVSELFPENVGRVLGIHGMASQVAAAGAPLIVLGVLAVGDWRLALQLVGVAAAFATVALIVVSRRTDLPEAGAEDRDLLGAARAQIHIVLTGIAITGTVGFVWNGLFNFFPTYLVTKGLSETTASTLLSVVFAAGIPAFWITGRLADRVPNVPLLLAIVGGFIACLFALVVTTGFWPIVAVSLVLGYVIHSLFPAIDTYMLASLPDHHRASAYTVYSASMMFPQAAGSYVVGQLSELGFTFDLIFAGLGAVLTGVLAVLAALYWTDHLPSGYVPT